MPRSSAKSLKLGGMTGVPIQQHRHFPPSIMPVNQLQECRETFLDGFAAPTTGDFRSETRLPKMIRLAFCPLIGTGACSLVATTLPATGEEQQIGLVFAKDHAAKGHVFKPLANRPFFLRLGVRRQHVPSPLPDVTQGCSCRRMVSSESQRPSQLANCCRKSGTVHCVAGYPH